MKSLLPVLCLAIVLSACTKADNTQTTSSAPDSIPTTRAQWYATAKHNGLWYMQHKAQRRALLKRCDAHHNMYQTNPDCGVAHTAAIGAGDF
jgi:hypothetical protein